MSLQDTLAQRCHFQTDRLTVCHWHDDCQEDVIDDLHLAQQAIKILTPAVTKALPPGWQHIDTEAKALAWLTARDAEAVLLTLKQRTPAADGSEIIGFLLLHADVCTGLSFSRDEPAIDLKIGYLLAETSWGQGLGNELIAGLVDWCQADGCINSVSGGVEADNIASIRVLEKNGFQRMDEADSPPNVYFLTRTL